MASFIQNLRSQPESVRKRILNLSVMVLLVVLVIIWGVILKFRFTDNDLNQGLKEDTKVFKTLTNDLSNNLNVEN